MVVHSDTNGGGEHYLRLLYQELASRGHDVLLVGSIPDWGLPSIDTGIHDKWSRRTVTKDLVTAHAHRKRLIGMVRELDRSHPLGLVHLQYKREQVLLTRQLSRLVPVLWTEHGRLPFDGIPGSALARAYARSAAHTSRIICVSDAIQRDVDSLGPALARRTVAVGNGIDTIRHQPAEASEAAEARRRFGIAADAKVITSVARLHADKGISLAIKALKHLPDTILIVAGDGPQGHELHELATSSHVSERVIFTGHLVGDLCDVFAAADVFVFPSTPAAREGSPFSVLEAAAHGLPIVATRGSGVETEVEAAGGECVPSTAEGIVQGVLRAYGTRGHGYAREWALGHDLSGWIDQHEELMTTASSEARDAGPR